MPLPGQRADFTQFQRPVFIRNYELHGAADHVTFESLYPRHWPDHEHSDGWRQLFFFYEWYINQWENREAFKIQKQEHGKICKYGDPGLWPAHCFSWEKMGPSLPQWAEMTSDCSYRLQHLLSPGPWKEVGEDLNTSKNFSKVKKALSIHFYTCLWCRNISHRGHSLHCSLATSEYLSFVLLPLSYPWHIWLNHFFSTSLIVGKFDQNSQLTLNSVLVMN